MTVLRPLSGHPETVRALALGLGRQGEQLLALAETLRGLTGPDVSWRGPAAVAFAARARPAAGVLVSVGRRHAVAAVSLRSFADALEEAQRVADGAVAEHEVALPRAVALGNARVEAEQSADPAQRAVAVGLRHREIAELERAQAAEHRHAAAWREFQEADRRCAAILRQLLEDGLADSRTYDTLTGVSRAANGIADVAGAISLFPAPPAKAMNLVATGAGVVAVGADVSVKLGYGDGDWWSIGWSAAAAASGGAGRVLKRGGLVTNPAALGAVTRSERRLLRYGVGDRIRLGVGGELRRAPQPGGPRRTFVARPNSAPGAPLATAHWLAEQARARTAHAVRVRWLDDFAVATRDPGRSRAMLMTGFGATGAATTLGGVATVREHQLVRRQSRAEEQRDRRHSADVGSDPTGR